MSDYPMLISNKLHSFRNFLQQKGNLKSYDELSEIERLYYSYTCREGDVIRMCNIPTPQMTTDDLTLEKKILELSKL